jgi:hypothetical protein
LRLPVGGQVEPVEIFSDDAENDELLARTRAAPTPSASRKSAKIGAPVRSNPQMARNNRHNLSTGRCNGGADVNEGGSGCQPGQGLGWPEQAIGI